MVLNKVRDKTVYRQQINAKEKEARFRADNSPIYMFCFVCSKGIKTMLEELHDVKMKELTKLRISLFGFAPEHY